MGRKSSTEADSAISEDPAPDEPLDQAEVNKIIKDNLTRLKHGDLFMEGLDQDCFGKLIGGGKMTTNLSKFLTIVAAAMVKAEGGADGSAAKKRKKKYLKALKLNREHVEEQIRLFEDDSGGAAPVASPAPAGEKSQPDEPANSAEPAKIDQACDSKASKPEPEKPEVEEEDEARSNEGLDDDEVLDEETTHDGSSSHSHSHKRLKKKSKKKKRKHKEKKKPRKEKKRRSKHDLDSDSDGDVAPEAAALDEMDGARARVQGGAQYLEAKKKFEQGKQKTLDSIPKDVKACFRQLCFSNWSKTWLPAVELGPYDVSPGPVREQWFTMYKNVKKSKRPLTRLVYWYGTPQTEMGAAYSFQPAKSVIPYDVGVERNMHKLPPKVQKKLDNKKSLSKTEQQHQRALEEIQSDLGKDPEDRLEWTMGWEEEYEQLAAMVPLEDDAADDLLEDDEPLKSADESSRKTKKKKKRKKGGDLDTGKSSKKGKKRKKSKEVDEEDEEDEESSSKRSKKSKKRRKKEREDSPKVEIEAPKVEMEEDIMNEEIPSDDDEKDDDFRECAGSGLESDEELDGEEPGSKNKDKKKAVLQKKRKTEMTEEEKEQAHQEHLARRRERDRQRRMEKKKEKEKNCPLAKEQRLFEECEELFLPMMSRLERAVSRNDSDLAEECLNELRSNIDMITPPFVRAHGIGLAIKKCRKALEDSTNIKTLCHGLTKELKRVYLEKDKHVAKDFKPKMSSSEKGGDDTKSVPSSPGKPAEEKDSVKIKADDESNAKDEPPPSPKKTKERPQSPVRPKEELSLPRRVKDEAMPDQSIPKKTQSSSVPAQPAQQDVPKAAPAKPARKSGFSLKGMFEKPKPTPKAADRIPSSERSASAAKAKSAVKKEIPKWLTVTLSEGEAFGVDHRNIALEFLSDAARHFPEDDVNAEAAARALESAIFDYSQICGNIKTEGASDRVMEVYWEKVHDISASIVGKQGQGSLYRDIIDGVYSSAMEVAKLKMKSLLPSLEKDAAA
mmetsp:Transcript_26310/g.77795  ORF Transcript_26310/g.77795 Transcript_26310/m.77795 type:complete len:1008 (-) Transcript_26310:349-3372(-)|eukprot:CAMPEP_0113550038 /NCGR_PEP_ID=MMETSP0015_2-20120614/13766_1 /TAXON_ID=2838 /ORGANISM="Odontella" /LENGTH=1007 /DNA_ID=CAMNT_0000450813 /DNA_START=196 /DNA_END=3219 /DNA_ORIENTATION=+ /assembly_acc=CAM_ASM_000160